MTLHRRQFLIGPRPISVNDDWRSLALVGGLHLSWDPALPVSRREDDVLLGMAVETDPDRPEPAAQLGANAPDTDSWAGRWLLIRADSLELDATGTLGCLTRRIADDCWASSSAELLRALAPALPETPAAIVHERGMDWYPPPGSGIDGIRRLLPSQRLRLSDWTLEPRRLLPPPPVETAYEDLLLSLQQRLTTALGATRTQPGVRWLPLSGGRDSRTLLAAAQAAGLGISTYTLDYPSIERGDRELPPKLARAAGYGHTWISERPPDATRLERWDRHTGRQCVDIDRHFYACGQLDPVAGSALDLGGGVFETGRCYYHGGFPADLPRTAEATAETILGAMPSARPGEVLAWAEWLHATHDHAIDWRDRFYIEQRIAGWLSTIAQGLDLAGVPRVHLANCAAFLSETLAVPEEIRRAGFHHDHLVARMAPGLATFPFNPPPSLQVRVRRRVAHEVDEYRAVGGPRRYLSRRARRLVVRRAARRSG